jgi:hypothetical protein
VIRVSQNHQAIGFGYAPFAKLFDKESSIFLFLLIDTHKFQELGVGLYSLSLPVKAISLTWTELGKSLHFVIAEYRGGH